MSCLAWIAATGSLVAATGASVAAWRAVGLLALEKKREGEREAERKRAKLVATIERELVPHSEWTYYLRIRNYGQAEARAIEVSILSVRHGGGGGDDSPGAEHLRELVSAWNVRYLGPGGWYDLSPLRAFHSTIDLKLRWEDDSGRPGYVHTELSQGYLLVDPG